MSLIGDIIAILLIVLIVMTAIREPTISKDYFKAYLTTGYKLVKTVVDFCVKVFSEMKSNETNKNITNKSSG